MITYKTGNIFDSDAEALVNTVNTVGVMGKGIALQFKKLFPTNYKIYLTKCKQDLVKVGNLLIVEDSSLITGPKTIINFPTKKHWRQPSKYEFIKEGVQKLKDVIIERDIKSIAIPPLGSGNGGLKWGKVRDILESSLIGLGECEIHIYEPNSHVKEILNKERIKLTDARALLLYVLFKLVKNGEFVSEFSSEKICYFLQRFGAYNQLKLEYKRNFYGPYSGKVRHVLYHLNGSYVNGYHDKSKKPFDYLSLIMDAESDITEYIHRNPDLKKIANKTAEFLEGYYSNFGLELLSSIDFIMQELEIRELDEIKKELSNWSDRKRTLFSNDNFIEKALSHIKASGLTENFA